MRRVLAKAGRGVVLGVAWFFVLTSAAGALLCAVIVAWPNDIDSAELVGMTHCVGLEYAGRAGIALAVAQGVLVFVCLVLSRRRGILLRRVGHWGLVAWASLFLGNALWSFDPGNASMLVVAVSLGVFWVCVLLRAAWGWGSPVESRGSSATATQTW